MSGQPAARGEVLPVKLCYCHNLNQQQMNTFVLHCVHLFGLNYSN